MERYKNLGGHSSVQAFELGQDSITVEFNDGATYLYDGASTGNYPHRPDEKVGVRWIWIEQLHHSMRHEGACFASEVSLPFWTEDLTHHSPRKTVGKTNTLVPQIFT